MLMRVTYIEAATYNDDFAIKLGGRDENGERRVVTVTDYTPYLFAPAAESAPDDDRVASTREGYTSFDGQPLQRIALTHPQYARGPERCERSIRQAFTETYEADIPLYRRCALDGLAGHIDVPSYKQTARLSEIDTDPDVEEPITPRICIGDIEVLPDYAISFAEMKEQADQPMVCATFWDSYTDVYRIFAIDPEMKIDTAAVKDHLAEHWPDDYEEYVSATFKLTRVQSDYGMAKALLDYFSVQRFDVVGGWNFVDFDWEYILRYIKNQGLSLSPLADMGRVMDPEWASGDDEYPSIIERSVAGLPAFDMMEAYCQKMTFHNWRSQALDYVADEELDVGKVEGIDITSAAQNDFSRLLAYNIIDVQLLVAMEHQNEIYDFFFNLADISSILIYDTFSELRLVDGYILSRRSPDEILPNAERTAIGSNAGGLVLDSDRGIEDWVGVFDLASLYPSCIITCNISTETMGGSDVTIPDMPEKADDVGGEITNDDIGWDDPIGTFSMGTEGIIPKYVKQLFTNRQAFKDLRDEHDPEDVEYEVYDRKQASIKVIMNSFYGVMSSKYWRLGRHGLGDAVTGAGRYVLWTGARIMAERGYRVIAGDTDSVILRLCDDDEDPSAFDAETALDRGRAIESDLNTKMQFVADDVGIGETHPYLAGAGLHGTDQHCLVWEFEKLYRRFLGSGRKKRYAGHIIWKEGKEVDDVQITGFESQRSDVPELAAEAQEEVIWRILDDQDFESISEYVREKQTAIEEEFDARTHALPSVINKPVEEYPNRPMKRAVNYTNEHLGTQWDVGDSPWLVYVSRTPPDLPPTDVIAIEWTDSIPNDFTVDTRKMQEKNLQQPLSSIIEIAGYDWREVKTGRKVQSITEETEGDQVSPFASGGASSSIPEQDEAWAKLLSDW